jgi:hypothetical protein
MSLTGLSPNRTPFNQACNYLQVNDNGLIRFGHRRPLSTLAAGIMLLLFDSPLGGLIIGGASFC